MLGEGVREARDPGDRGRDGADQDEHARHPDRDPEDVHEHARELSFEGGRDPDERRLEPLVAERGLTVHGRICRHPDRGDRDRDEHYQADGGEERARECPAGLASLFREVGGGLEPRVREHRER